MSGFPEKILLIKPGAIGDLLQISPTVRSLRKRFPEAEIHVMVSAHWTMCLFANNPNVSRVLYFDRKGDHRSWGSFLNLWQDVRREGYDLVINFQRSTLKVWLLVLAAFPSRVMVYHKSRTAGIHAVLNHMQTVAPLGIDPAGEPLNLEMFLAAEDLAFASRLIQKERLEKRTCVALNLGASHPVNRWPIEKFASLAERLTLDLGAAVLLIGGNDDRELADGVLARLTTPVVDLVGRTSLTELGAVLQRCKLVVSADTGPLHLATAVGTPVIALFGAADPERTGPVGKGHVVLTAGGLSCVPCRSRSCSHTPHMECMQRISVADVMEAAIRILEAA